MLCIPCVGLFFCDTYVLKDVVVTRCSHVHAVPQPGTSVIVPLMSLTVNYCVYIGQ